jgi:hypothetical protein
VQTRLGSFVEGVLFLVTACIGVSGGTSLGRGYDVRYPQISGY